MDKLRLVNLCSRAWSIRALALIADGCPARVSPLAAAAGCGRTAMGASVEHLLSLKLLQRNPGHGHPLRPEYRLTVTGVAVADWALTLAQLTSAPQEGDILRGKWALPVLGTLNPVQRYSELRRSLAPVTDRALTLCLGRLTDLQWVQREVCLQSTPPAVNYEATGKGIIIHQHLQQLIVPGYL